jgi:hypothetical protein
MQPVKTTDAESSDEGPDHRGGGESPSCKESPQYRRYVARLITWIPALILLIGATACSLILGIEITASKGSSSNSTSGCQRSWCTCVQVQYEKIIPRVSYTKTRFRPAWLDSKQFPVFIMLLSEKKETSAFLEDFHPEAPHLDFMTGEDVTVDLLPNMTNLDLFTFWYATSNRSKITGMWLS